MVVVQVVAGVHNYEGLISGRAGGGKRCGFLLHVRLDEMGLGYLLFSVMLYRNQISGGTLVLYV